jgi:DNA-binding IscR family transcriptional regulator
LSPSREADHAVRALAWLAAQPAGSRRKAAEIANAAGIPGPFAARVLAQLNRAELLHARAGQDGACALHGAWASAQQAFRAALGATPLTPVVRSSP